MKLYILLLLSNLLIINCAHASGEESRQGIYLNFRDGNMLLVAHLRENPIVSVLRPDSSFSQLKEVTENKANLQEVIDAIKEKINNYYQPKNDSPEGIEYDRQNALDLLANLTEDYNAKLKTEAINSLGDLLKKRYLVPGFSQEILTKLIAAIPSLSEENMPFIRAVLLSSIYLEFVPRSSPLGIEILKVLNIGLI